MLDPRTNLFSTFFLVILSFYLVSSFSFFLLSSFLSMLCDIVALNTEHDMLLLQATASLGLPFWSLTCGHYAVSIESQHRFLSEFTCPQ